MPQALAACTSSVGVIKPTCKEKAEWVVRWTYIRAIVNVPTND